MLSVESFHFLQLLPPYIALMQPLYIAIKGVIYTNPCVPFNHCWMSVIVEASHNRGFVSAYSVLQIEVNHNY